MFKKILAVVTVLFIISLAISGFFGTSDAEKRIIANEIDNSLAVNGLSLDLMNAKENKAVLRITDLSDELSVKVTNIGEEQELILKVFYDYEEIAFKVSGEADFQKQYIFNLDGTNEANLNLQLSKEIKKDDLTHKLLISIYPNPKVQEKSKMTRTSNSKIIMNYDITYY